MASGIIEFIKVWTSASEAGPKMIAWRAEQWLEAACFFILKEGALTMRLPNQVNPSSNVAILGFVHSSSSFDCSIRRYARRGSVCAKLRVCRDTEIFWGGVIGSSVVGEIVGGAKQTGGCSSSRMSSNLMGHIFG